MSKRVVSIILLILLLIGFAAFADDEGEFSYKWGLFKRATITGYNGTKSKVVIPSQIDGYTVTYIGEDAFRDNPHIREVVIPSSVVGIEKNAFRNCVLLEKVTLQGTYVDIDDTAFDNTAYYIQKYKDEHNVTSIAGVSTQAHMAGVAIGLLIVVVSALVYFVVIPANKKNKAAAQAALANSENGNSQIEPPDDGANDAQ